MALKATLFLFATFLLVSTGVSADDKKQLYMQATYVKVPVPALAPAPPVKAPAPAPPVTAPIPPTLPPPPPPAAVKPPITVPPVTPPMTPVPPVQPPAGAPMPPVKTRKDCIPLCGQRCRLHSRQGLCLRACMTCCDRCKCVPPGTYGNKEKCGQCYTGMTTRRNKPKCP